MKREQLFRSAIVLLVVLFCLVMPSFSFSQIYQVYRPAVISNLYSEKTESKRWFLAITVLSSQGVIEDRESVALTRFMSGFRLQGMFYVNKILGIGIEFSSLVAKDKATPFLTDIQKESIGVISQWIFTPDTQPILYLSAGVGQIKNISSFEFSSSNFNQRGMYAVLGLGVAYRVSSLFSIGAEARVNYYFSPWKNFVFEEKDHFRPELSIGINMHF